MRECVKDNALWAIAVAVVFTFVRNTIRSVRVLNIYIVGPQWDRMVYNIYGRCAHSLTACVADIISRSSGMSANNAPLLPQAGGIPYIFKEIDKKRTPTTLYENSLGTTLFV